MSSEPKPRSMAAVTIEAVRPTCSSDNKSGYLLENPVHLPVLALSLRYGSDNPRSAGNQQERPESVLEVARIPVALGNYLAGFVDGEGSFNVSFRPRTDYAFPWKISLCFNVSQRDPAVLQILQAQLGCGTLRQRADGVWYFEVNTLGDLIQHVIPFFGRFGFLSAKKQRDFAKFVELASLLRSGRHLTREGVVEVLRIRLEMNDGGKRRYLDEEILRRFENPQRPYARRSRKRVMIWSDLHGDMQSTTEMIVPLALFENSDSRNNNERS